MSDLLKCVCPDTIQHYHFSRDNIICIEFFSRPNELRFFMPSPLAVCAREASLPGGQAGPATCVGAGRQGRMVFAAEAQCMSVHVSWSMRHEQAGARPGRLRTCVPPSNPVGGTCPALNAPRLFTMFMSPLVQCGTCPRLSILGSWRVSEWLAEKPFELSQFTWLLPGWWTPWLPTIFLLTFYTPHQDFNLGILANIWTLLWYTRIVHILIYYLGLPGNEIIYDVRHGYGYEIWWHGRGKEKTIYNKV